jgi:molybdate transport system substrate-binding protein
VSRFVGVGLVAVLAAVLTSACSGIGAASPSSSGSALTILAASSLTAVMDEVARTYPASHPGVTITVSTDSSAALETQIEQGASADVFLSADTTNLQKLADAGLISGQPVPFAGNALTVVVPKTNPARICSPADLAREGVRVIAAGDSVPITKYADQLLANLARVPGYPADFASKYTANVVSREDNVRAVVMKVGLGEGDAAIVYATDAKASKNVMTVEVPAEANVLATYAGVVVKASPNQAASATFLQWLAGPEGQAVLARAGFRPAPR